MLIISITLLLVATAGAFMSTAVADAQQLRLGDRVTFTNGNGVSDVKVDLFEAASPYNRGAFVATTRTGSTGYYGFNVQNGCFILVFEAPTGTSFSPSGPDQWDQRHACISDASRSDVDATLHSTDLHIGDRVTYSNGTGASGVKADLFTASGPHDRQTFLETTTTNAGGYYQFDATNRCYIVVFQAPAGASFSPNGPDRWDQQFVCVDGSSHSDVDTVLYSNLNEPSRPECFAEVFRDDFNGSGAPDPVWYRYDSVGNAGFGIRNPDTITVGDGVLNINASMRNGQLHSGGMSHNLDQAYGFYQFRVRVDADVSEATSAVVLTWPESQNQVPDGENDMFETIASDNGTPIGDADRRPVKSFMHYTENGTDRSTQRLHKNADGSDSDGTVWAIHAMEWTPGEITFYRNGIATSTITQNVPTSRHHVTIQLDAWKNQMGAPVDMQVDWVEIRRYTC